MIDAKQTMEGTVDYGRFERLVLGLGAVVIVASIYLAGPPFLSQEIAAQLLIIAVLLGAVHWGRNGGFAIAVAATLVYVLIRIPLLLAYGLTEATVTMIATRMLTYCIVGVLGGEACGRLKYLFANIEANAVIDDVTTVYNARYIGQAVRNDVERFQRYQALTSVVLIKLSPDLLGRSRSADAKLLHRVAAHIRGDVRVIDDVGHIRPGEFCLLLGQTPRTGAEVTADRVRRGVRDLIGAPDAAVGANVLALPEDLDALMALATELGASQPQTRVSRPQPPQPA